MSVSLAVALLLPLGLGLAGEGGVSDEPSREERGNRLNPAELLESAWDRFVQAESYSGMIIIEKTVSFGEQSQTGRSKYRVSVQRPNKFAMEVVEGRMGATTVSDGDEVVTFFPALNRYRIVPMADSLSTEERGLLGWNPLFEARLPAASIVPFASDADLKRILDSYRFEHVGEEEVDGEICSGIRWVRDNDDDSRPKAVNLWVRANGTPMLRRIVTEGSQTVEDIAGPVHTRVVIDFRNWETGVAFEAKRFEFVLPEGATEMEF